MNVPAVYIDPLFNHLTSGSAYIVQVLRKDKKFFAYRLFAFDDKKPVDYTWVMAGIDLNPQNISFTIGSPSGWLFLCYSHRISVYRFIPF